MKRFVDALVFSWIITLFIYVVVLVTKLDANLMTVEDIRNLLLFWYVIYATTCLIVSSDSREEFYLVDCIKQLFNKGD